MEERRANTSGWLESGDPLRAWAAMGVFTYHVFAMSLGVRSGESISPWLGRTVGVMDATVFIFLAISGYLIARPFARALVLGRPLPSIKAFLVRRVLRIFPLLWFFALATIALRGTLGADPVEILAVFGAAQVYAPSPFEKAIVQAWTLHVELVFYLLVPLAAALFASIGLRRVSTPARRAAAALGILALAGVVSFALRASVGVESRFFNSAPAVLYAFYPGLALCFLEPVLRPRLGAGRLGVSIVAVASLIAVSGAVLQWRSDDYSIRDYTWLMFGGGVTVAAMVWEWTKGRAPIGVRGRAMQWFGARTFSFYMAHVLVLHMFEGVARDVGDVSLAIAVVFAGAWVCSVVATEVAYRLVESPCLRLAGRVADRVRSGSVRPAPAPAAPARVPVA